MPVPKEDILHRKFGLLHHSHTGRRLHKSHTSYPLLAVLLLMVGVLLLFTSLQAHANTVTVTAIANGPAPVQPAVILSPENDDRFTNASIPVTGTCPAGYYVKLFRNTIFSGSALCSDGDTFAVTTDLFVGRNDLQAKVFNLADEEGPSSAIVTVYYDPPTQPGEEEPIPPPEGSEETPSGADPDTVFYLSTEYYFKAAYTGQKITWDFKIMGGSGPYTAYVVWGDGYSTMEQNITGDTFTIEHAYNSLKDKREYFSISVRVQDAAGQQASLQLVTIMNDPNVIGGALVRPDGSPPAAVAGNLLNGMLKYLWSAYGILLLMGVCFWLGEKRGENLALSWYRRRLNRRQHA